MVNPTNVVQRAVSPDGTRLALAMTDERIELRDLRNPVLMRELPPGRGKIRGLRFVPNSAQRLLVIVSGTNPELKYWLWNFDSNEEPRAIETGVRGDSVGPTVLFALSPDGRLLAIPEVSNDSARIRLHNLENHTTRYMAVRTKRLVSAAFSPDSALLAAGGLRDRPVRFWEMSSGRELESLLVPGLGMPVIEFSPDGKTLLTCDWDGVVRFWSVASRKEMMAVPNYNPMRFFLLFSPDGSALALPGPKASAPEGEVEIWTIPSLAEIDGVGKVNP
jgi:WD40 repeat protein